MKAKDILKVLKMGKILKNKPLLLALVALLGALLVFTIVVNFKFFLFVAFVIFSVYIYTKIKQMKE